VMDDFLVSKELPENWVWAKVGDLGAGSGLIADGDWILSKDMASGSDVRLIQLADIGQGYFRDKSRKFLAKGRAVELGCTFLQPGDILVSRMADPIARTCRLPILPYDSITAVDVTIVRPDPSFFDAVFLSWLFNSRVVRDQAESLSSGTTRKRISRKNLQLLDVPLPPLAEQRRIVAKIEELFSQLDAGVAALDQAKAQLARYRQAVLKHAFEGKLTEAWREAHKDELEPASVLLERIKVEREKASAGKRRRKALPPLDTSELPELPEGWVWTQIRELATATEQPVLTGPFGTSLGRADFISAGVPLLTIGCLTHSGVALAKARFVSEQKASQLARYALRPGDLLFSRMATIGRAGYVGESLEGALFNYHLMRLRLDATAIHPKYCLAYLQGDSSARDYIGKINHGATRGGVNTRQLLGMPVALAPMEEQLQILSEIEERLSVAEYLASGLDESLRRAQRLRQSILKRAFEGKLVLQDPNDEPAEVLLERIKAEKTRREAERKACKRRKARP